MKTWTERAADDPSLQRFIAQEIAQAYVELESLRVEVQHWKAVAENATKQLDECQIALRKKTALRMTDKPSERRAR